MKIIYTRHARKRMIQRKVTPGQVETAIMSPDEILPGEWNEEIAVKHFGTKKVQVVYEETGEDTFVIYTVISKRLRKQGREQ